MVVMAALMGQKAVVCPHVHIHATLPHRIRTAIKIGKARGAAIYLKRRLWRVPVEAVSFIQRGATQPPAEAVFRVEQQKQLTSDGFARELQRRYKKGAPRT